MGIEIRPGAVDEAGTAMTQLGEDVASTIGSELAANQAAVGGHRGWESAAAATQAAQAWENRIGSLAGQLGQLGTGCVVRRPVTPGPTRWRSSASRRF
jgi:hypothetical protein